VCEVMELNTPLNQAHFLVREAERFLKKGKFEEAIKHQDKIVALLTEAKEQQTVDNRVRESLTLQIQYHSKQKAVISHKQKRCDKFTKDLKNLHIKMAKANLDEADGGLQDSIYRTFQETESLLQHLRAGGMDESASVPSDPATGAKMPKDDKIIIEELQTANNHLRGMVEAMFAELETYKRENAELRSRVSDLEAEKRVMLGTQPHNNQTVVVTGLLQDSGHLPPLAPLELPEFDYGSTASD